MRDVAQFPADRIAVLVPQGTTVSSPQLTSSGTATGQSATSQVYERGAVKAGDSVSLSCSGDTDSGTGGAPW